MKDVSYIIWQKPFDDYERSNYTNTPSYAEVGNAGHASQSDYPFTMQSYPATNYPDTAHDYDVMSNSWTGDELGPATSPSPPRQTHRHQQQQQQQSTPVIPDAIINMAAKVGSDKKPFAYVADVNDIRQQRDRVRRKYVIITSLFLRQSWSSNVIGRSVILSFRLSFCRSCEQDNSRSW